MTNECHTSCREIVRNLPRLECIFTPGYEGFDLDRPQNVDRTSRLRGSIALFLSLKFVSEMSCAVLDETCRKETWKAPSE